ncbi:cyclic nucleotide-binding domain-containing protein [Baaleninema sp.]|uniref:cyclic nucleotide-binding domain-containing protein n=1 Tax=Baaleninema sp. TaxID=3101197 RepID=UPI003CFDD973
MKKAFLILGELNNEDIDWLARQGRKRTLDAGGTLIYEGQQISALYFVLQGEFSVVLHPPDAERELARIAAGEVIGEISFIDNRLPIATVNAVEPSEILEIPRFRIVSKLNQDAGFASRFYRGLSLCLCDRMRATVRRLGYGTTLDSPELSDTEPLTLHPQDLDLVRAKFQWLVQQAR